MDTDKIRCRGFQLRLRDCEHQRLMAAAADRGCSASDVLRSLLRSEGIVSELAGAPDPRRPAAAGK